ncbi:hypothetical protein [Nitratifractor sp.]|uniref:hypothetical protein n=1 Tax=Nitratifractor sp. TaxID=2268144 RepID=UPI0025E3115C|nr:hypothetical protein [Nitratifractor sp.]
MKLYEVGPKPIVNQHGVSFDTTHPDRYPFISPAIELLETLDFDTESEEQHLHRPRSHPYRGEELEAKVLGYCDDIEKLLETREAKTQELIEALEKKVAQTPRLSEDEKRAWLGNIASMRTYYLQYLTNETVYRCLLEKLADRFTHSHIASITFPLRNNFGLVLDDLGKILQDHKPPFDAEIKIEDREGTLVGRFVKYVSPEA